MVTEAWVPIPRKSWEPHEGKKLNIGSGNDYRPGYVNMDITPLTKPDVIQNMLKVPWPFEPNTFDYVVMRHVLEHVPHNVPWDERNGFFVVLEEIMRIMKPGGILEINVPHYESREDCHRDPTHSRIVHPGNFAYVTPGDPHEFYSAARFELVWWACTARHPRLYNFMKIGKSGMGLTSHLMVRAPALAPLWGTKAEATYIVRRV